MLLRIGSIIIVALFFAYYYRQTRLLRGHMSAMRALIGAVAVGALTGLVTGTALGTMAELRPALAGLLAVLSAGLAGWVSGRRTEGASVAVFGAGGGILGAVIGLLFARLAWSANTKLLAVDVLLIVVMMLLQQAPRAGSGRTEASGRAQGGRVTLYGSGMMAAGLVLIAVLLTAGSGQADSAQPGATPAGQVEVDEENGLQTAVIEAGAKGFQPARLELRAGIMAKLDFRLLPGGACSGLLTAPDLEISMETQEGDNYVLIKDLRPGIYTYACGNAAYTGEIAVK
ncbi:hypothetical protein B5M42_016730 [Paenibacillus athensensis]|uniref:EfeO-type cupredoxin-like domain-containing protein n=1 Tax=Paenibacillus athensensis TaxID=1967502 RepID=A0A4Y8PZ64_9BACL|nr:hypothetical protein [Paenibacillus athensensis]MCD1260447.1 hypothetical protein [Paenibacillus athensensis]